MPLCPAARGLLVSQTPSCSEWQLTSEHTSGYISTRADDSIWPPSCHDSFRTFPFDPSEWEGQLGVQLWIGLLIKKRWSIYLQTWDYLMSAVCTLSTVACFGTPSIPWDHAPFPMRGLQSGNVDILVWHYFGAQLSRLLLFPFHGPLAASKGNILSLSHCAMGGRFHNFRLGH